MKQAFLAIAVIFMMVTGCNNSTPVNDIINMDSRETTVCSDDCKAKSNTGALACKLISPELQERKATSY